MSKIHYSLLLLVSMSMGNSDAFELLARSSAEPLISTQATVAAEEEVATIVADSTAVTAYGVEREKRSAPSATAVTSTTESTTLGPQLTSGAPLRTSVSRSLLLLALCFLKMAGALQSCVLVTSSKIDEKNKTHE